MQLTIKIDPYSRTILLLILGCLVWLCLEKTTASTALARSDDPPKEKAPKVREFVAARSFVVVDKNGKIRAALSAEDIGPHLTFLVSKGDELVHLGQDELSISVEGEPLFDLSLSKSGSRLLLSSPKKKARASLMIDGQDNVFFRLNHDDKQSASLSLGTDGMTNFDLRGDKPQERISLTTDQYGWSSLSLGDSKKAGFHAYASCAVAGMKICDGEHAPRMILGSDNEAPEKEPAAWMRVIGKDGKDRWSTP